MISEAQNGFREKNSITATQTFIEYGEKALDNKLFVMGIFLDLTKAFDVINYKLLLAKLELYGLRGKIHSWMSSYRIGRTEFVEIQLFNEKISNIKMCTMSHKEIKYGVPQDSVLGLLLLLLFINDLPKLLMKGGWCYSQMTQICYSLRKITHL
jgi:hypothetical protein